MSGTSGTSGTRGEVVAIDGPAGSGKSSTAREVARVLGFDHVESGAFYRAATLTGLREGLVEESRLDGPAIGRAVERMRLERRRVGEEERVFLNGEDVHDELRSPMVTRAVSRVSAEPEVRGVVTRFLRRLARPPGMVMDGRDIGTVVFPDAGLKIFLDASIEERARRRSAADGRDVAIESLRGRDVFDSTRATSPLTPAADAVVIHSDELTLQDQVDKIVQLYRARTSG
jgi:cytidylate kinase